MLDVGSIEAYCHFDFIKYVESVFFHFESWTLRRKKNQVQPQNIHRIK